MRSASLGTLFFAALATVSSCAWAQEQPPQSSFTALLAKDYEVKSVTLVPLDVAKRATESVKTDTILVTLQNKQSVAVCYIAFANWAFEVADQEEALGVHFDTIVVCTVTCSSVAPAAARARRFPATTTPRAAGRTSRTITTPRG